MTKTLTVAALTFAFAAPAAADGLERVPFAVRNDSGGAIACEAALAHWFSAPVGGADAGGSVAATLWSDRASGTVYLKNERGEAMPVQVLWCGRAGAVAATRADVALERRAGVAEPAVDLACAGPGPDGRLACTRR